MSCLVGWYVKTRGVVEGLAEGMSAAGSEVITATHGLAKINLVLT